MKYRFEQCLQRGKIVRIPNDPELVAKELREAGEDLVAAERTLAEGNAKWVIIQGYYAQFHALRALVFSRGYREKSHSCLRYAVRPSMSMTAFSRHRYSKTSTSPCARVKARTTDAFTQGAMPVM
jgi:uncharacterized protein (UPF0332 family)